MFWSRLLLVLGACVGAALAFSTPASADDGKPGAAPAIPPRATPVARGFVEASFAPSFSALVGQAVAAATDLTTASARARALAQAIRVSDAALGQVDVDADRTDAARERKVRERLAVASTLAVEQDVYAAAGVWSLPSADAHWTMPVTGGLITQPFGPTRLALEPGRVFDGVAYAHFHDGVDIAAPFGT